MKTAISIPDGLFRRVDRMVRKLGISRSQFYAEAAERYLQEKDDSDITRRLIELYGPNGEDSKLDPQLAEYTKRKWLERTEGETW
jgi:hypothetical protein